MGKMLIIREITHDEEDVTQAIKTGCVFIFKDFLIKEIGFEL